MLELRNIRKRFGGLEVLTDVSFEVPKGSLVGLIGPNGAGKTTLFNIMTGFHRADGGSVWLQGRDITTCSPEQRSGLGIARTFQLVKPFNGLTVLENVMVGAYARTSHAATARRVALEALAKVGLEQRSAARPADLTLPDRKRMEMARCLALEPGVLLLDEVMCGLNPTDMQEMIGLIHSLRVGGMTIVLVEHLMEAINELADEVVVLSAGKVLARGVPAQVLRDSAVVQAYLGEVFEHAAD